MYPCALIRLPLLKLQHLILYCVNYIIFFLIHEALSQGKNKGQVHTKYFSFACVLRYDVDHIFRFHDL